MKSSYKFFIIGAGIHGLSTAWHLVEKSKQLGKDISSEIIVVDKKQPGAGATGIACGVVRNNYLQPAMRELMAHSVDIWNEEKEFLKYHPVGYIQASCEVMHDGISSIYEEEKAIGFESEFIEGEADSFNYMKTLLPDWKAKGITSILHEKKCGYANNMDSVKGLVKKCESLGVTIKNGVEVTGFNKDSHGAISSVITNQGTIQCEQIVVAVGPWVKYLWDMLELPPTIDVRSGSGVETKNMWHYWALQEGTLGVNPNEHLNKSGQLPPVVHVDTDEPLYSIADGRLITDKIWGIYYKPDFHFNGIQGGAMPYPIKRSPDEVVVDPYGPESPEFIVDKKFAEMWCSALAFCQGRFENSYSQYRNEPSGGIGCFTPDYFPIFDRFCENLYLIADSNHGYKMIGVGKLVAQELLEKDSRLLAPFRISRYNVGATHPESKSPYPWS